MPPRAIVLAPLVYPPSSAEAIVTLKLVIALSKANWVIDTIGMSNPSVHYNESESFTPKEIKDRIRFVGYTEKTYGSVGGRIPGIIWGIRAGLEAARLKRLYTYDLVISRVMPQFGHLGGLLQSVFSKTPWVACWSDPMPAVKAPPPYGKGHDGAASPWMMAYCKGVVHRANLHVFPSELLRAHMLSYLPNLKGKSAIIPHVALDGLTSVHKRISDKLTLCHAGSLEKKDISPFLSGLAMLFERVPKARQEVLVKFVGGNVDNLLFNKELRDMGPAIENYKACSYERTLEHYASSDIGLLIEAPMSCGIFLPSKAVDIVQSDLPILAVSPTHGTMNDLITRFGGGISVSNTQPAEISRSLELLYRAWKRGELVKDYDPSRMRGNFTEHRVVKLYESCLLSAK